MKTKYLFLSFLLTPLISISQVTDSFTGTGALNNNGWTTHSGTPGQIQILNESLTYTGITTSGNRIHINTPNSEDVNLANPSDITGVCYYSLLLNVTSTNGLNPWTEGPDPGTSYFMHLSPLSGTNVGTLYQARLAIRAGSTPGTFQLGIYNNGGTTATSFISNNYSPNETYFIVVKYDLTLNKASLWINPAIGIAETTPTITNSTGATSAPSKIKSLCIRQASNFGAIDIDEVKLGTTWEYVTNGTLGVKNETISGLKIYPNPVTNGVLNIESFSNTPKTISIFDLTGKQLFNATNTNSPIDISNLKAGLYMVSITEGNLTETRKLIVK